MNTKRLLLVLASLWISSLPLSAQTLASVNHAITQDTTLATIQSKSIASKTVMATGQAVFSSKTGYVRVLLSDDYGYDLLVYESMPLVATDGIDNFSSKAMETVDIPSSLALTKVRVEIKNAELKNLSVEIATTNISKTQQQQERTDRITLMSSNLRAQNALWLAGETSVSQLSYQEKKGLYGGKVPDLQGFEYYVSGIFELHSDRVTPVQNPARSSPYVPSFDWRNRHGANNPASPYYNGPNGWITSVKDQIISSCYSCWAFAALGPLEAIVNLYYNQKINVDLSEQELVSCDNNPNDPHDTHSNFGCMGGLSEIALEYYIKNNGIIDEWTFPYVASYYMPCSQKPTSSIEKITITDANTIHPANFDQIKKDVMEAPLAIGFSTWGHSVTLIGYRTLQPKDSIYLKDGVGGLEDWVYLWNNDERVGQTALLFKDSRGDSWGENGFGYILVENISDINDYGKIVLPITSEIYIDDDIVCEDRDGDGYYFWGIGPKPATCPCWAPDEPDGDDFDSELGPMDEYGHCAVITPITNITTSQTWNTGTISNNLTIQPNVTLTITGVVSCAENVSITVKPGGKLVLNGGTLTAAAPNKLWKGIIVLGDPTKQQLEQYQGKVELKNSALIEHALCAISAAPTSYCNAGGGIITATNATFRNNKQAIEYRPFENKYPDGTIINNVGKFTKCTFIIDNYNHFGANGTFFNYHVTMWEVRGVTFEGCTFNNTTYDGGGACLYTMDAGFKVVNYCSEVYSAPGIDCACSASYSTPTTFKNHAYGVFVSSTGNPHSIYIDQSEFQNLMYALRISNHDNYRFTRCTVTGIQGYGIYSFNSSGYRIEENKFFGSNNFQEIRGIDISNSGYVENRIYKNDFTNINKGICVWRLNAPPIDTSGHAQRLQGLQFICNNFTDNKYDIYIGANATVRSHQGSLSSGAGNAFWGTQISSFYSQGSQPQQITYYYSPFSVSGKPSSTPYNPTSNITLVWADANSCASTFCLPDGGGGGGENPTKSTDSLEQYKSMQQQYDEWLAQLKDNPELLQELLVLSDAMRELSDHAISRILGDSILYLENLKPWYEVVRTPVAKYSLAEVHFYERKYDQAEMVLNAIPNMFEYSESEMTEHNNYMRFYNFKKQLQLADRNWTQLDETEIVYLQTIAEATNGRSASMAQGVLCFFFDICYEDKIEEGGEVIPPTKNMDTETQLSDNQIQNLNYELSLYPNPTSSEMTVTLNNPAVKIVEMAVYDLFGKKVHQQTVNQSYSTLKMNELLQGVYILQVRLSLGEVVIRKVVKE